MMPEPYTVKTLLKHPSAIVNQVHLEPGHETPRHSHPHDYIVHPRQDTTLVKTTYKGNAVISTETVTHTAGTPYVVSKSEDGTEFTIKNTGSAAMMCDKTLLPPKP
jgi:hypothetical protein